MNSAKEVTEIYGTDVGCYGIDSVYFLMFPGWKDEPRSNRWHFASRWAARAPVVLVQPDLTVRPDGITTESEARIDRCEILHITVANDSSTYLSDSLEQLAQVLTHMKQKDYVNPLLWCYNPNMVGLYALIPAVYRLYHATENYFHFSTVPEFFLDQTRLAMNMADRVVAVSDGVADSVRQNASQVRVSVVSNGCDYKTYSTWSADEELSRVGAEFKKTVIYAGGINWRLDFELLLRCALEHGDYLFAFYGRTAGLKGEDKANWEKLLSLRNTRYFGYVPAERLPNVYGASNVGIIPYKRDPMIRINGFPLKALEMGSCSLPVVSTYMQPLTGLTSAIAVTETADEFLQQLAIWDRRSLSEPYRMELHKTCQLNDYDHKFAEVLEAIAQDLNTADARCTRIDDLVAFVGRQQLAALGQLCFPERQAMETVRPQRWAKLRRYAQQIYSAIPETIKLKIPTSLRGSLRRRFGIRQSHHS